MNHETKKWQKKIILLTLVTVLSLLFLAGCLTQTTSSNNPHTPKYIDISDGGLHSIALKNNGTVTNVWCTNDREIICVVPKELTDVISISAGNQYSLALKDDGTVIGWGAEFGPYVAYGQADVPANLTDVIAISAGYFHSLALKNDGTVVAWGSNETGQCNVPENLTDVIAISAGKINNFALKK